MSARLTLAAATAAVALLSLSACGGSSSSAQPATQPSSGSSAGASTGAGSGQGNGAFAGRNPGTSGQIAAISGKTLQVQNQQDGQVAVSYTSSTAITAEVAAALSAVKVGSCVTVTPASSGGASSGTTTSVTAGTVRITQPTSGSCTAGFGGGGFGGTRPSGAPSGFSSGRPSGFGGNASDRPSGAPGRGGFGANGEVTAVSATGFTVKSSFPAVSGSSGSSGSASNGRTVTVTVSGSTTYTTTESSDAKALKVGKCVVATGQADDTGAVAATRLVVSDPVDGSCSAGFGFGRNRPGNGSGSGGSQGTAGSAS